MTNRVVREPSCFSIRIHLELSWLHIALLGNEQPCFGTGGLANRRSRSVNNEPRVIHNIFATRILH